MGDGADRTRGCRVGRARTLVVAAVLAVAPTLVAPTLVATPARADTTTAAPAGPAAVRVAQAMGGSVVHPLYLEVLGYDLNGNPLVTNSATPTGYTPATVKSYPGLSGTGTGQTIAI